MPNYRESLPSTLESGLQDGQGEEIKPIDRLRAFSLDTPRTGTLLWRLIYDLDSSVYADLVSSLVQELNIRRDLVELAVHEYMSPSCKRCNGARELVIGERKVDCPACKEHPGIHRPSDKERAQFLRCSVTYIRRQSKKIAHVTDALSGYDRAVNVKMGIKLAD